jgi:3-methyladenine DNA glycosylase AlkD
MQQNFVYTDYPSYLRYLNSFVEEPFAVFQRKLIPGENILGVRTPTLRAIAKRIAKGDWRAFLADAQDTTMEEVIVQGFVVGCAKMDYAEALERAAAFVPKIKSWATCDLCGSSFPFLRKNPDSSFAFLQSYLSSKNEFEVRFAVTLLMEFFVCDESVDRLFPIFDGVRHEGYYVKMAVAWGGAVWFLENPERTMKYLKLRRLGDWTYNKALQKITESRRVDAGTKEKIRAMKRRTK